MYIVMFISDMISFESLVTLQSILSHLFFYWLHFNFLVFVKKLCQHHCCLSFDLKIILIQICKYNIYWLVLNDLFSGRNVYFLHKRGGCQNHLVLKDIFSRSKVVVKNIHYSILFH